MPKRIRFYVDKDPTHTVYIQAKSTGLMQGRRPTKKGERQDKILNVREKETGRVHGFLPEGRKTIPVKGSSSSRGYIRRSL